MKKDAKRKITLQEAFDVIAEELVKIGHEHCAFIGYESGKSGLSETKLDLNVMKDRKEVSIVKSSKTVSELERSVQE
ncbi:hypothetical protein [Bacillus halotolerans]|uniref:hypothetical protein n=1 Tax=Bacillus halotolerans TaxID=260554 RepID=UPI002DB55E03|nr:hypothetical protein [Bacillus halotolerans]MEC1648185.1 hypothetical protein [Bacillus halotolerans]